MSISASNLFQNASQFSRAPLYFVMTSFGSLTFCLLGEPAFSFANSAFCSSCCLSNFNCSSRWRANRISIVSLSSFSASATIRFTRSSSNVISVSAASIFNSKSFPHSLTLSKASPPSSLACSTSLFISSAPITMPCKASLCRRIFSVIPVLTILSVFPWVSSKSCSFASSFPISFSMILTVSSEVPLVS